MTEIKSVNAPAIGHEGVKRLFHLTREKTMTAAGGSFQAGYEQAKRDFLEALRREVGNPHESLREVPARKVVMPELTPEEMRHRKAASTQKPWWHW